MVKIGKYGGEKIRYPDGEGCCIWTYITDEDGKETSGICYDFPAEDIDQISKLLEKLKAEEATVYEPDPDQERREREHDRRERSWWRRIHRLIEDIGLHVTPFDWRFSTHIITRPVGGGGSLGLVYKWCEGFSLGPVTVTWGREIFDWWRKWKKKQKKRHTQGQ